MIGDFTLLYGNDKKMCDAICMAQVLYDDGSAVYNATFEAVLLSVGRNTVLDFESDGSGEISYDYGETWESFGTGYNSVSPQVNNQIRMRSDNISHIRFLNDTYKEIGVLNALGLTSANEMFYGLTKMTRCLISGSNKIINFDYAWYGCSGLTYLYTLNSGKGASFIGTFYGCSEMKCLRNIDTSGVNDSGDTANMFVGCAAMVQPDASAIEQITGQYGYSWVNNSPCPA